MTSDETRGARMKIPFLQVHLPLEVQRAVDRTLVSGQIGPGLMCERFAEALSDYTGAPYVLLTNSGTTALEVVLRAVFHRPTSVVVPVYGESATARAVRRAGHMPIFVDVTPPPEPPRIDMQDLARMALGDYVSICTVNFSGNTDTYLGPESRFVEDAACAIGHRASDGRHAGTLGLAGILSFSPHKLVTTGQGGAAMFKEADHYHRALDIVDPKRSSSNVAGNFRMCDLQAAMGLAQLELIDSLIGARCSTLIGDMTCLSGPPVHNIIFAENSDEMLRGLFAENSDEVLRGLRAAGIDARRPYGINDGFAEAGTYPNAERWKREAIFLPMGSGLTMSQCDYIRETAEQLRR